MNALGIRVSLRFNPLAGALPVRDARHSARGIRTPPPRSTTLALAHRDARHFQAAEGL